MSKSLPWVKMKEQPSEPEDDPSLCRGAHPFYVCSVDPGAKTYTFHSPEEDTMNDLQKNLELLVHAQMPVFYKGRDPLGAFLFSQGAPFVTHAFESLSFAVSFFGRQIKITTDAVTSPRHHAGFNDGLMNKPYFPQTRSTDGGPRELTERETREYDFGYMEGLLRAIEQENHDTENT